MTARDSQWIHWVFNVEMQVYVTVSFQQTSNLFHVPEAEDHRIVESFGLEGTLKITLFQHLAMGRDVIH